MKKLMFAMAAIAAGVAVADVTSANVVGYMTYDRPSKYSISGSMFVVPGDQDWKLNDLKLENGDFENDYIQVMLPNSAQVDRAKTFYYDSDEEYWCYRNKESGKQDEPIEDDYMIPAGTAFLCVFNSSKVKLTYAGEVQKGSEGEIAFARIAKYAFMANPLPYEIDLTKVSIEGGDFENDYIQFMQQSAAQVDRARTYYYDGDENYWCYRNKESGKQDEEVLEGEVKIGAGVGILAVFNSSKATLVFPAPAL